MVGRAAQAHAAVVVALLRSGELKKPNGNLFNSGGGADQYKGTAAQLFPRLVKDRGIAAIAEPNKKNETLASCINRHLRPMIFNGANLEDKGGDKLGTSDADMGVARKAFVDKVTTNRKNHRKAIELGLLLYALDYTPDDYIRGQGWNVWELDLIPLRYKKKAFVKDIDYKSTDVDPTRIVLLSRDNGYRFVSVKHIKSGVFLPFRANTKQLMDAWRSDGSANENATAELTWLDAKKFVSHAINKPLDPNDLPAMASLYIMLLQQVEKHPELAALVSKPQPVNDGDRSDESKVG
jgi:hypothetical protein